MPGLQLTVQWRIVRADQNRRKRRTPVHKTFYNRAVSTNKQDHSRADMGSNWWLNILRYRIVYDNYELFYCWRDKKQQSAPDVRAWEATRNSKLAWLILVFLSFLEIIQLIRKWNFSGNITKMLVNEGIWTATYNILINEILTCPVIRFLVMHFWNWTNFPQHILDKIYYIKHIGLYIIYINYTQYFIFQRAWSYRSKCAQFCLFLCFFDFRLID